MAGYRPTQVVIGIAGELVKGFTTSHVQERKRPNQAISESELQKLIDGVQRQALKEAERAITWETGLPNVDVRLVHAAVTGAQIDGYAVTNPVGFQGRHVRISIFNAFAPLIHIGALQSVAARLDLELLAVVAEPYAVARCVSGDAVQQAGALFIDVGGGTTDVALVRQGGSRARACSRSGVAPSRSRWPTGSTCPSSGRRRSRSISRVACPSSVPMRSAHRGRRRPRLVGRRRARPRGARQR
jgi:cell division ATPase FtsA